MKEDISILRAEEKDAADLTDVQVRAFQIDVSICGDGPPGYNSVEAQIIKINQFQFYKITQVDKIVGGFYLRDNGVGIFELIRLFISPDLQGKGLGCKALEFIETEIPGVQAIELEASDFRPDNHRFYENRGYIRVGTVDHGGGFSFKYRKSIK